MDKDRFIPDEPEIWKDIIGFEGHYQVSSWGNVKSLRRQVKRGGMHGELVWFPEKLIKTTLSEKGYRRLKLALDAVSKSCRVCRLVALHFVPNPDNLPEVNHDDLDKENDYYKNLSWSTHGDNIRHAFANRIIRRYKNGDNPTSKKVAQYDRAGNFIKAWPSINELRRSGFNYGSICSMCKGTKYVGTHVNGFIWKYV